MRDGPYQWIASFFVEHRRSPTIYDLMSQFKAITSDEDEQRVRAYSVLFRLQTTGLLTYRRRCELTPVCERLYRWIVNEIRPNHPAPSLREMVEAMGVSSPSSIQRILNILVEEEYISSIPRRARSITIIPLITLNDPAVVVRCIENERLARESYRRELAGLSPESRDLAMQLYDHYQINGRMPSLAELTDMLGGGGATSSAIYKRLKQMESQGVISWSRKGRSMKLNPKKSQAAVAAVAAIAENDITGNTAALKIVEGDRPPLEPPLEEHQPIISTDAIAQDAQPQIPEHA